MIYFFAVTLFQTGLAYYETLLMHIPASNTFMLMAIMTIVSLALYLPINRMATKIGKKKLIIVGFFSYAAAQSPRHAQQTDSSVFFIIVT